MNNLGVRIRAERDWSHGQVGQPLEIFRSQLVVRPDGGRGGNEIKTAHVGDAGTSLVVITANEQVAEYARTGDDFVRASTVADDVAKVCYDIEVGRRGNDGVKCVDVRVNVAEQKESHGVCGT